ncbi:uncharacterized protein LOC117553124 isoform X2 [Gymnodraco acuticeps]|uniref:Uncharacterized protein LOC117553124 isoform X2 n=1 Tax=Gymnodraco acuticeps TaxID=8218 RepID=A0A6P8V090_GYMAC|nr:uncharacterized protein LOC117553124 isoform X2 [Gymnodraco acuticeps]
MPRSGCVSFCTTNKLKNPNLKLYILPNGSTEPRRRTRWLQAIRREDELEFGHLWDPTSKHVYVCSQHFITGWGGRASDVHIVRNSDFLSQKFHHAGDQILADRGFTLKDDFAVLGAQLITPSLTRGRKQLSAEDVANSNSVTSNIRIHIGP